MKEIIKKIKIYIANDKLGEALQAAHEWSMNQDDREVENTVITLLARFNSIKRNFNQQLIRHEALITEQQRISMALIETFEDHADFLTLQQEFNTPQPTNSPNNLLFLASNPSNGALLQLEKEFAMISHQLQESKTSFKIWSQWAVTTTDLLHALLKHEPNIIHFSGHGYQDGMDTITIPGRRDLKSHAPQPGTGGGIVLEDGRGGAKLVEGAALQYLFSVITEKNKVDAVILNACYSRPQAEAIGTYVPYVIGMSDTISDQAAIEFSTGFYISLGLDPDIERAYKIAKANMMMAGIGGDDLPVLYKWGEQMP